MKRIENRAMVCRILAGILLLGLGLFLFRWMTDGGGWASSAFNRHLYNNDGELVSGTVLDRDGDILSTVEDGKRSYYSDATVRKATLHVVGDRLGNIGTGALNAYADKLSGYDFLNGAYGAKAGNNLYLTIDARYNFIAYQALGGKRGTVAVYNYKTGEILCLVSAPSYDPLHVPADIETNEAYHGAYLNRFLSSTFTPGSVFKTVTMAAAIEEIPDIFDRTFTCTGTTQVGDDVVTCPGAHGTMDIYGALTHSCNGVFAQLAVELGAKTMEKYTVKAGLTDSYDVSGLPTAKGTFQFADATENQLGWSGVGQYQDAVNPCALMVYMGAIANRGRAAEPRLLLKTTTAHGFPASLELTHKTGRLIAPKTADILTDMLSRNVTDNYGTKRFPNMDICAKSGTAEVAAEKSAHAWFTGFLRNEDAPLAFVVLVENGGGGSSVAGTVAGKVLDAIVNGY
ncbi:MAG: penicillin-binding transpeptidase domain-containing protein [Oscillospiraceae bacterium]